MFLRVADIKQGNQEAYYALYEMYHMKVYRFFLKRVTDHDDTKDLTQDCFLRLWRFRHTLSEDYTVEKQLFVMAYHVYINFLEKKNRAKINAEVYLKETSSSSSKLLYWDYIDLEKRDQLTKALESLSPACRKIMQLRLFHGYNNNEIAQKLDISSKTVENQISKAVKQLKGWLCREVLIWVISFLLWC